MSYVEYTSWVPELQRSVKKGTPKGIIQIGSRIIAQAKTLCPRDTNRLANSLGYKTVDKSTGKEPPTEPVSGYDLVGGSAVPYAGYIEYGTRRMGAQPYLRPAVDMVVNGIEYLKAMSDSLLTSFNKSKVKKTKIKGKS